MASLLFHELAHANDFIPPAQIPHLNPDNTVLEAAVALEDDGISAQLYNDRPLQSEMLFGLAQVMRSEERRVGEEGSARWGGSLDGKHEYTTEQGRELGDVAV